MAVAKETSADAAISAVWAELVDIFVLEKTTRTAPKDFSQWTTLFFCRLHAGFGKGSEECCAAQWLATNVAACTARKKKKKDSAWSF